jgi:hypothetical protein
MMVRKLLTAVVLGNVCLALCAVWPAASAAKQVESTNKWFGPEGRARNVVARIDGRQTGLDAAITYVMSGRHRKDLERNRRLLVGQTRSDHIPCIVEGSRFRYRSRDPQRPLTPVQEWAPWGGNPSRNLRWSHQGLSLAGCYLRQLDQGDTGAAKDLKLLLSDWYAKNAVVDLPDREFSWGDHTTAFRLRRIVAIFLDMDERGLLDREMTEVLLEMAYSHTRILLEESEIRMKGSNHALDQAQALFVSALAFPFLEYPLPVVEEAYKRAQYEAEFLVAADGVQTENSPAYHQWVPVKAFTLLSAMARYLDQPLPKELEERMSGATRFATWIPRPDGYLPMIGDTGKDAPIRFSAPAAVDASLRNQFRFVKSYGEAGTPPSPGTAIFEKSGYLIFRNRWSKGRSSDDIHMVFKCGMLSDGHRHNDDGNILLFAFGSEWLSDAGMFGYERKNPKRAYAVSPQGHNVSIPVGMGTVGRMGHPRYRKYRKQWGLRKAHAGNGAHCTSYMYEDAVYQRDLRIGRNGVGITDNFSGGGDVFLTQFRIPADKSIEVDAGVGRIRICDGAKRCLMIDYSPDAIRDVQLSKGRDEYGESFDTIGYLRTADVQTVRLTWKRGVATSAYSLRFDGAEFFPGGPVLEEGRAASVPEAAVTRHDGYFRWVAAIAGILLALAAMWAARNLVLERKRRAAVASSHPIDSANA